jgi:hypothetical protein
MSIPYNGRQATHPHEQQEATAMLVHSVDWKRDMERFRDENVNKHMKKKRMLKMTPRQGKEEARKWLQVI